jgi:hypothetical protein
LKQIKIANPTVRNEGAMVSDIADAQTAIGAAQQELAGLEARRSAMLASGTIDEIYALVDSVTRAKLKIEIAETRLDALNKELAKFYETAARAAVDAAMAPLAVIADEERATVRSYEEHAVLLAADLARLVELDARRHQVSVAVHRLTGTWTPPVSPIGRPSLGQVRLPSAEGGADHWPSQSAALIEVQARAARDLAALAEYHRGDE